MSQTQVFTDQHISQAIEALIANGQNVTSWAVQAHLGGGDFTRIEKIISEFNDKNSVKNPLTSDSNINANQNDSAEQFLTEDIVDKNIPADIESSMSEMQNALGDMANKIWNDAATKAEDKVREKLFSVQKAHDQVKKAHLETKAANKEMQGTLSKLNDNLKILEKNYQESQTQLKRDQQELSQTKEERDSLIKNVGELEEDNQTLEQTAFDSKLEIAKSEGLAETIKEQLELVKKSEKQFQAALDRSEKKVDALNIELHDISKTLRDEIRDRLTAERMLKQQEELNQEAISSQPPLPNHDSSLPIADKVAPEAAPITDNLPSQTKPIADSLPSETQAKPNLAAQEESNINPHMLSSQENDFPDQNSVLPDNHEVNSLNSSTPAERPRNNNIKLKKTRSLSEKLFDRKKKAPNRIKR